MMARTTTVASPSTRRNEARVSFVGLSESAMYMVPWGTLTATTR